MNETLETISRRRSVRAYKSEQIKEDELKAIVEAGLSAPSAMNQQSWHISVVQNKDVLAEINNACKQAMLNSGNKGLEERAKSPDFSIFYNAPTLIIVSGDEKAIAPQNDCTLTMENMFLAAASLEIGSCWINAIQSIQSNESSKDLQTTLGIPEGYRIYTSGAFGYNAGPAPSVPARRNDTVTYIK